MKKSGNHPRETNDVHMFAIPPTARKQSNAPPQRVKYGDNPNKKEKGKHQVCRIHTCGGGGLRAPVVACVINFCFLHCTFCFVDFLCVSATQHAIEMYLESCFHCTNSSIKIIRHFINVILC